MSLLRVESYRDGVLVASKTVPNRNVAKVLMAHLREAGLRTLLVHPRTETERAL